MILGGKRAVVVLFLALGMALFGLINLRALATPGDVVVPDTLPVTTATPLAAGSLRFAVIGDYGSNSAGEGQVLSLIHI